MANGVLFSNPVPAYYDALGVPFQGAKLLFFENGTTTPAETFADVDLVTPNSDPIPGDGAGRFITPRIFLDPDQAYRVELQATVDGTPNVSIWIVDDVNVNEPSGSASAADKGDVIYFFGDAAELAIKTAAGWKIPDGTLGTPNIIGAPSNFFRCATNVPEIGLTGGSEFINAGGIADGHVLTAAELPAHNHAQGTFSEVIESVPTAGVPSGVPGGGAVNTLATVGNDDAHEHTLTVDQFDNQPQFINLLPLIFGF